MRWHPKTVMALVTVVVATPILAADLAAQVTDPFQERAGTSRTKGSSDATVVVYELSDFQCPYCATFANDVFPRIDSAFVSTGRVRWVFVHLPLPSHTSAWVAHEAAVCAGALAGRFWEMHDKLFQTQNEWSVAADPGPVFTRQAAELGVPEDEFQRCIARDLAAPLLIRDLIFSARSGVDGTPAFVIDQEQTFVGAKSYEEWHTLLEAALAKRE